MTDSPLISKYLKSKIEIIHIFEFHVLRMHYKNVLDGKDEFGVEDAFKAHDEEKLDMMI